MNGSDTGWLETGLNTGKRAEEGHEEVCFSTDDYYFSHHCYRIPTEATIRRRGFSGFTVSAAPVHHAGPAPRWWAHGAAAPHILADPEASDLDWKQTHITFRAHSQRPTSPSWTVCSRGSTAFQNTETNWYFRCLNTWACQRTSHIQTISDEGVNMTVWEASLWATVNFRA